MKSERHGDWMITASGRQVWPFDPRPEDFTIDDIAHGLSMICRYGGHTQSFYSVAQHSILVSKIIERFVAPLDVKKWAFIGLLHDASEAYLGDVIRPIKRALIGYKEIESRVQYCIAERFNIPCEMGSSDRDGVTYDTWFETPEVKHADNVALITERRDLLSNPRPHGSTWKEDERGIQAADWIDTLRPLGPVQARNAFLNRYEALKP